MKNIVMLAHDPGGYDVIMPLYRMIRDDPEWNIRLLLVGPAGRKEFVFEKRAEEIIPFLHNFKKNFGKFMLVTGTSWSDDTELDAISYCKCNKITTIAILDYWTNYRMRFVKSDGRLELPDHYFVMDEIAMREAVRDGIDKDIISVVGHPALDDYLIDKNKNYSHKCNVLFASQPLESIYGLSLGYTETMVTADLVEICDELDLSLRLKFHPKDTDTYKERFLKFGIEGDLDDLMYECDIFVGMSTMGLLHSVLRHIKTISYQPNLIGKEMCITNILGLTRCVRSKNELKYVLNESIKTPFQYLESTKSLIWMDGKSRERCIEKISDIYSQIS